MRSSHPRSSSLFPILQLLLYPSFLPRSHAAQVNITVDDTSSSIVYSPSSAWHTSSVPCSNCLAPDAQIAFDGTWHDGTHIIPTVDADDLPQSTTSTSKPSAPTSAPGVTSVKDTQSDDDDDDDKQKVKGKAKARRSFRPVLRRRGTNSNNSDENPFFTPKLDSDDPGFVDQPVTAQFNFTGSAVYVYALIPLGVAPTNTTPTHMNLTYILDSQLVGSFVHNGSQSASGYLPSTAVFVKSGLNEGPHELSVYIAPDSVFLFDYLVYSQDDGSNSGDNSANNATSAFVNAPSSTSTDGTLPSQSMNPSNLSSSPPKTNNIATFAGAIGGSVGLLAVLASCLAFSIFRRRRSARRRDRHRRRPNSNRSFDVESSHTNASEDGPPMQGPAPFVPRYFPGTMPIAPPPYDPSDALLSSTSPPLSPSPPWPQSRVASPGVGEETAYTDNPHMSLPHLLDDIGYPAPPPSFAVAISTPVPAFLAQFSNLMSVTAVPSRPPSISIASTEPVRNEGSTLERVEADSERAEESRLLERPPSSASEVPPSIPQPEEVLQAERERRIENLDDDSQDAAQG